jgi:hypothetical protein
MSKAMLVHTDLVQTERNVTSLSISGYREELFPLHQTPTALSLIQNQINSPIVVFLPIIQL